MSDLLALYLTDIATAEDIGVGKGYSSSKTGGSICFLILGVLEF